MTKAATFFLTRFIIQKPSDNFKVVCRRMEILSNTVVKLTADLKFTKYYARGKTYEIKFT